MRLRAKLGDSEMEAEGDGDFVGNIMGSFYCLVMRKHKRGKKVGQAVKPDGSPHYAEYALYECPRCHIRWNRKIKSQPSTVQPEAAKGEK